MALTPHEVDYLRVQFESGQASPQDLPLLLEDYRRELGMGDPNTAMQRAFNASLSRRIARETYGLGEVLVDPHIGVEESKKFFEQHGVVGGTGEIAKSMVTAPFGAAHQILTGQGLGRQPLETLSALAGFIPMTRGVTSGLGVGARAARMPTAAAALGKVANLPGYRFAAGGAEASDIITGLREWPIEIGAEGVGHVATTGLGRIAQGEPLIPIPKSWRNRNPSPPGQPATAGPTAPDYEIQPTLDQLRQIQAQAAEGYDFNVPPPPISPGSPYPTPPFSPGVINPNVPFTPGFGVFLPPNVVLPPAPDPRGITPGDIVGRGPHQSVSYAPPPPPPAVTPGDVAGRDPNLPPELQPAPSPTPRGVTPGDVVDRVQQPRAANAYFDQMVSHLATQIDAIPDAAQAEAYLRQYIQSLIVPSDYLQYFGLDEAGLKEWLVGNAVQMWRVSESRNTAGITPVVDEANARVRGEKYNLIMNTDLGDAGYLKNFFDRAVYMATMRKKRNTQQLNRQIESIRFLLEEEGFTKKQINAHGKRIRNAQKRTRYADNIEGKPQGADAFIQKYTPQEATSETVSPSENQSAAPDSPAAQTATQPPVPTTETQVGSEAGGTPVQPTPESVGGDDAGAQEAVLDEVDGPHEPISSPQAQRKILSNVNKEGYAAEYIVVELGELIMSMLPTRQDNPAFPAHLQPRNRDRAALWQIASSRARNIEPDWYLADVPYLQDGTPIIGPDMVVESGNGRVLSLTLASIQNPQQYGKYLAQLTRDIERYGLTAADLEGKANPVIVRRRLSQVNRRDFVREANDPNQAGYSSAEQAAMSAENLSDALMNQFTLTSGQNLRSMFVTPQNELVQVNKPFIVAFLAKFSPEERNKLTDDKGMINADGIARIEQGMLARTFPGDAGQIMVSQFIEQTSDTMKRLETAIREALPELAAAEHLIHLGVRPAELTIAEDIAKAVTLLNELHRSNTPVVDFLRQGNPIADDLSDTTRKLIPFIDQHRRGTKRFKNFMKAYADMVMNAEEANTTTGDLFGDQTVTQKVVDKDELVDAALEENVDLQGFLLDVNYKASSDPRLQDNDESLYDAQGNPIILYHGSPEGAAIEASGTFDPNRLGERTGAQSAKRGFFFTDSPDVADSYADPYHDLATDAQAPEFLMHQAGEKILLMVADLDSLEAAKADIQIERQADGSLIGSYLDTPNVWGDQQWIRRQLDPNLTDVQAENVIYDEIEGEINKLRAEIDRLEREEVEENRRRAQEQMEAARAKSGTVEVHLILKNPLVVSRQDFTFTAKGLTDFIEDAQSRGHDGVIFEGMLDPYGVRRPVQMDYETEAEYNAAREEYLETYTANHYVVFNSNQIINAKTGNRMAPTPDGQLTDIVNDRQEYLRKANPSLNKKIEKIIKEEPTKQMRKVIRGIYHNVLSGKPVNLVGKKIRSATELAVLAQSLRDGLTESTRIVYLDDNLQIIRQEGWSMNRSNRTTAGNAQLIDEHMQRLGARYFIRLHNHPSTTAILSPDDVRAVEAWRDYFGDNFMGDVVIDSGTYAYAVWNKSGEFATENDVSLPSEMVGWDTSVEPAPTGVRPGDPLYEGAAPSQVQQFQTATPWGRMNKSKAERRALQEREQEYAIDTGTRGSDAQTGVARIESAEAVANLGALLKTPRNWVTLVMVSNTGRIGSILEYQGIENLSPEQVDAWIRAEGEMWGGEYGSRYSKRRRLV